VRRKNKYYSVIKESAILNEVKVANAVKDLRRRNDCITRYPAEGRNILIYEPNI